MAYDPNVGVRLLPHVPTCEAKLAPILRESPKLATFYETLEVKNGPSLGPDVVTEGILPFLDRRDEFLKFSLVHKSWTALARFARATAPACARDIRIAIEFGMHDDRRRSDATGYTYDGDYELSHKGLGAVPMTLYCYNIQSDRPTEFLSLQQDGRTNYSFAPAGGSCVGRGVRTSFSKLRIDPWSLTVKTDDYTFAETSGGPLRQSYWNGLRIIRLNAVPYATARDSLGNYQYHNTNHGRMLVNDPNTVGPEESGTAMIDLRGTCFGVENAQDGAFRCMGYISYGRISVKDHGSSHNTYQRIHLAGGGYAGRLVPHADRTRDETAFGGNYDDEGSNGGWVLPLRIMTHSENNVGKGSSKWVVTEAVPVE